MPRKRCPAGQVWSESEGRCVKQLPRSSHSGNPRKNEKAVRITVKNPLGKILADKVVTSETESKEVLREAFVKALLEKEEIKERTGAITYGLNIFRDGKYFTSVDESTIAGALLERKEGSSSHSGNPERW